VAELILKEFILGELTPPLATDDCSPSVAVTGEATEVEGCKDVTITWTATDECNQTTTAAQKVRFTDSTPPAVVGGHPGDLTVACGNFPAEQTLTFWDYCAGDIDVFSKDSLPAGAVCDGQKYTRTWEGPSDDCQNKADSVTQTVSLPWPRHLKTSVFHKLKAICSSCTLTDYGDGHGAA